MQQVKIFEDNGIKIEENINWWLECNPTYKILNINIIPTHDLYPDGTVCNQWTTTIVIYEDGR